MLRYYLESIEAGKRRQVHTLEEKEVLIGRGVESDIILDDPYVSRRHARLSRGDGDQGYTLIDLDSSHGSFVNDFRVRRRALSPGDVITFGRESVRFRYLNRPTTDSNKTGIGTPIQEFRLDESLADISRVFRPEHTLDSEMEKLHFVLDLQYTLDKEFSPEKTFEKILLSALKLSGAERGFILLKAQSEWDYVLGMDAELATLEESEFVHASRTVVGRVAKSGETLFMTEGLDDALSQQASIVEMNLRALACLPMKWIISEFGDPVVRGILYLDSTKPMHSLTGLDEKILTKLAVEASGVFEKVEMIKTLEEKRKVETELELARETQKSLLPETLPDVPGFNLEAFCRPTHQVGGDFYNFLQPPGGGLTAVLADVSGKGVSAALLSSLLQGALDMEIRTGKGIADALAEVNAYLCERTQANRFATVFLFHLNPEGLGKFVSAGHNPTYLWRSAGGEIDELVSGHIILGALPTAKYDVRDLEIRDGDVLLVYSDGLTEAEDPDGRMFGEDRLRELIRRSAPRGVRALREDILTALERFTKERAQTDDITFVILGKVVA